MPEDAGRDVQGPIRITINSPWFDEHTASLDLYWNGRWSTGAFTLWRHCDMRTNAPQPTTINWKTYGPASSGFAALFAEGMAIAVKLAAEFDRLAIGDRYAGEFADVASIESREL